jgi:hypothetical protein
MAKKFYDIIPPKEAKILNPIKKLKKLSPVPLKRESDEAKPAQILQSKTWAGKEKKSQIFQKIKKSSKETDMVFEKHGGVGRKKPKIALLKILGFCFIFLILLFVSGFFIFSKTEIKIWPKTEILTLEETITIEIEPGEKEEGDNRISLPGQLFEDQKSDSQEFSATGKTLKEVKAEGIIKVYNAYSTSDQPLLATTRFVSADGKLFRSLKREIIVGGEYVKGKFVPGETDIMVRAAEPGEDYNIEPSTFSIPGFVGTPKYTAFYGKSFESMTKGFRREVAQITQDDLDKAKEILVERLKKESKDFLISALPQGFVLLEETISQEVIEENFSQEAGAEAESFNFQAKVKSFSLIFKKSDLEDLAKKIISENIKEGKKFQEESLEIDYSIKSMDLEDSQMILKIEIKAKIYSDINLDKFKKALLGKTIQEVRAFLQGQPEINKSEINLSPFWRRKIPEDFDKVDVKLNID